LAGDAERVHATCVAIGPHGVLIRGPSGAGKSDLALRLMCLVLPSESPVRLPGPVRLVADDQVILVARDGAVTASPPDTIRDRIEVRGVGIVPVAGLAAARLALVVDLVRPDEVPRLPDFDLEVEVCGVRVPRLFLNSGEPSAPLKVLLALTVIARSG